MGENSSYALENSIYLIEVSREFLENLGAIRHWENILMATEEQTIWLKGFTKEQIHSVEVKIIPEVNVYELKNKQLFILGNSVPEKKLPSGLLWSEIRKLLTVEMPKNWQTPFQIDEKIKINIIKSETENISQWLQYDYDLLEKIIVTEAQFRFQNLKWIVVDGKALVKGAPALGIPGKSFWEYKGHVLPSGYDFEFPVLNEIIIKKLAPEGNCLLLWNEESQYIKIKKDDIRELSRSSVKLTKNLL